MRIGFNDTQHLAVATGFAGDFPPGMPAAPYLLGRRVFRVNLLDSAVQVLSFSPSFFQTGWHFDHLLNVLYASTLKQAVRLAAGWRAVNPSYDNQPPRSTACLNRCSNGLFFTARAAARAAPTLPPSLARTCQPPAVSACLLACLLAILRVRVHYPSCSACMLAQGMAQSVPIGPLYTVVSSVRVPPREWGLVSHATWQVLLDWYLASSEAAPCVVTMQVPFTARACLYALYAARAESQGCFSALCCVMYAKSCNILYHHVHLLQALHACSTRLHLSRVRGHHQVKKACVPGTPAVLPDACFHAVRG